MKELILIAIGAALVNNVVLSQPAWAERLFLSSRFLHL